MSVRQLFSRLSIRPQFSLVAHNFKTGYLKYSTEKVVDAKDQATENVANISEGKAMDSEVITDEELFGEELDPQKIALKQALFWLDGEGAKYKNIVEGSTNYVGGKIPFPMNPYFRPKPPLADKIKSEIYALYLKDPRKNTPRFLGRMFKISIKRVEAILKLKAIEAQNESEGITLQTKFQAGMESILGVNNPTTFKFSEPISIPAIELDAPRFKVVGETESFTAEDAAKELNREPFSAIYDQVNKDKFYEISYPGLKAKFAPRDPRKSLSSKVASAKKADVLEKKGNSASDKVEQSDKQAPGRKVLDKNPKLGNKRFNFVFTDTSKKTSSRDRLVLVRYRNGTLVNAGRAERQKRINQVWSNMNYVA
ncbi:37S ribosomal protein S35, mitochondrial [Smittium culicis]|uniref:37S ribosomal protein S35, mitochondrial n=1 Tax=Smittium culicis TaxID=133412 RepID=A0A1R1X1M1_9FUNG|nr:37S ribosomal protein S35, mitochondrial [Smittium culicis]